MQTVETLNEGLKRAYTLTIPAKDIASKVEAEVKKILKKIGQEPPKVKVSFTKGERVKVVDGPFTDFIGVVDDINPEKGKVRVLVSFFGRETPVELDFLQVQRIV